MRQSDENFVEATFLIVDDDYIDREMFVRTMKKQKIANPVICASDGEEGLAILRGNGDTPALARPFIIILDINMPRMNGFEFLDELRKDPKLATSVVFMMTTSGSESDIEESYRRHVAGYLVKTDIGGTFMDAIDALDKYQRTIKLPS